MKDRIRLWVKALRSGKYHQAKRSLRRDNRYCCLGVACDVYHRETGDGEWQKRDDGTYAFIGADGFMYGVNNLPAKVCIWFGLATNPILGKRPEDPMSWMSAIRANDDYNMTFDEIADLVEKEYLDK